MTLKPEFHQVNGMHMFTLLDGFLSSIAKEHILNYQNMHCNQLPPEVLFSSWMKYFPAQNYFDTKCMFLPPFFTYPDMRYFTYPLNDVVGKQVNGSMNNHLPPILQSFHYDKRQPKSKKTECFNGKSVENHHMDIKKICLKKELSSENCLKSVVTSNFSKESISYSSCVETTDRTPFSESNLSKVTAKTSSVSAFDVRSILQESSPPEKIAKLECSDDTCRAVATKENSFAVRGEKELVDGKSFCHENNETQRLTTEQILGFTNLSSNVDPFLSTLSTGWTQYKQKIDADIFDSSKSSQVITSATTESSGLKHPFFIPTLTDVKRKDVSMCTCEKCVTRNCNNASFNWFSSCETSKNIRSQRFV